MTSRILIAEDDPVHRLHLETMVRRFGYESEAVENGEQALARLLRSGAAAIDLLILDLVMPGLDGMAVLTKMRDQDFAAPAIVLTAPGSADAALSAVRAGARDFLVKPAGAERLQVSIKNALLAGALAAELRRLDRRSKGAPALKDISLRSEEMARVARLGERAANSVIPTLIEGEAGVGKKFVARIIQGASDRRSKPFVIVDCGALSADGAEDLLFCAGKEMGKYLEANGGTLFLDAIDKLPPGAQARLSTALQDGGIAVAGAKRPIRADVRLIAATSRDLIAFVKRGLFREDLFYRLNVFPVVIPPLRARREDIAELARRFVTRFSAEEGKTIRGVATEALALLSRYDWPGNVRQLENAVFRAVALAEGDELTVAEFPQLAARVPGFEASVPPLPTPFRAKAETEIVRVEIRDPNVLRLLGERGEMRRLEDIEAEAIRFALAHYRGQMSEIARRLGVGRSTLYRKVREYGLDETAVIEERAASAA